MSLGYSWLNKVCFLCVFSATLGIVRGDTLLWVGFDAQGPIQVVPASSPSSPPFTSFGPSDASGVALDHAGHIWLDEPGANKSVITEFDQSLNPIATINFTHGINNALGSPSYIEDMAYGGNNTLWLAGFNGFIYHIDANGNVLSDFNTGDPFTGVALDGSILFTSEGLSGGLITAYSLTGTFLGTIDTGLSESEGLAFDPSSGTLFIGGTDSITQVDLAGNIINASFVPGADHTGLDVGLVGTAIVHGTDAPEPSGIVLLLTGLFAILLIRKRHGPRSFFLFCVIAPFIVPVPKASAAITNLKLTPSLPSPQPLGSSINFQATAVGAADYQFNVKGPQDIFFHLLRDFTGFGNAVFSTIDHEGTYQIQVIARNTNTGDLAILEESFRFTSLVVGNSPTVNVTPHPLVALYAAPPCAVGSTIRVRWIAAGSVYWNFTPFKPCVSGLSMNFYVGGMLAQTTYTFQQDVFNGPIDTRGPYLAFRTGATAIPVPVATINIPAVPPSSLQQPILLHSYISTNPQVSAYAIATDLAGHVLWYALGGAYSLVRTVAGGTFLVLGNTSSSLQTHVLQEIDLVGHVIRETNASVISEQLIARGNQPITQFHHEARRLPNGDTVVLGTNEKVFDNVQGVTGPVDILGDTIMVLDSNFRLRWAWNTFDHLNINDTAPLGETCKVNQPGCPPLLTPVNGSSNDWTHSNSVDYLPADGSLLLSMRNQDKVLKINYEYGFGDGSIIFTLGKNADFTLSSSDPYPWFSHQHDVNYESNSLIDIFDDGNTRVADLGPAQHSRGQVLQIDVANKSAILSLNADLGTYSAALGSAQKLLNGNHHFTSGALGIFGMPPTPDSQDVEVGSTGSVVFNFQSANFEYRSFRMQSLYTE